MQQHHKNTIVFLVAWIGIVTIVITGLSRLPSFWRESVRLKELSARLNDSKELESRMNEFIENVKVQSASLSVEISRRRAVIDVASFTRLGASAIGNFIENLPQLFADAGVTVTNLGYQARETKGNFVDLPFVVHLQCAYPGMRKLLHALETHQAGIRIDQLEFINLDDDQHRTRLKLVCRVRFKSGEQ